MSDQMPPGLRASAVPQRVPLSRSAGWLTSARAFAVLMLALGLTCLAWSQWPLLPTSPRLQDGVIGIVVSIVAILLLVAAPRLSPSQLFLLLFLPLIAMAVLTATRVGEAGVIVLTPGWTLLAVTTALFLPRRLLLAALILQTLLRLTSTWLNPLQDIALVEVISVTGTLVVAGVVFILVDAQRHLVAELSRMASRDPLTGVLNRRGAELEATAVRAVAERASTPTTVALIDLDDFKAVNDRHGHETGDAVLRTLTQQWSSRLRAGDVLARIGGDEFLLVMPETSPESARTLLQRLRRDNPIGWTSGTVPWRKGQSLDQALSSADRLLYQAKGLRGGHEADPTPDR